VGSGLVLAAESAAVVGAAAVTAASTLLAVLVTSSSTRKSSRREIKDREREFYSDLAAWSGHRLDYVVRRSVEWDAPPAESHAGKTWVDYLARARLLNDSDMVLNALTMFNWRVGDFEKWIADGNGPQLACHHPGSPSWI
jgi:hypothetical protein